jgi:hypothetical protein
MIEIDKMTKILRKVMTWFTVVRARTLAKMAFVLFKLRVIDYYKYDKYVDKLQVRLFEEALKEEYYDSIDEDHR